MNLSTKLIADYKELVNQYLDSIPVKKEDDFTVIREALLSIVDSNGSHKIASSLKDRVKSIKEMINEPEIFVEDEKNYPEFKNIILQRVAAKIGEITTLSSEERSRYIENQKEIRERTLKNQSIMEGRKPPEEGSEAHVISEEEMLRQMQSEEIQNHPLPLQRTYSILGLIFDSSHLSVLP